MNQDLSDKRILLIISGGISAYKTLDLIRLLRKSGAEVRCILTKGGEKFVTPLSIASLSENHVYTDLWSLKDETEMGHIRLSRDADLIVIAPASANLIAQTANGLAQDLASTTLLAADKPILIAPAMNHKMWSNPATCNNINLLRARNDIQIIGPNEGEMACGETGPGRMATPQEIFEAITQFFFNRPLKGLKALVTSGPTFEPLDPVRFIGNRSSGKQGHAIAQALAKAGTSVTLISGPVSCPDPSGVKTIHVETAEEMHAACEKNMSVDIAVCAAAVSDWRPTHYAQDKIKKTKSPSPPAISLQENPDILKSLSTHEKRPGLVIGFAAETENILENAKNKLKRKGCDWILANDVTPDKNVFGGDTNHVYLVTSSGIQDWGEEPKDSVAERLVREIVVHLNEKSTYS